MARMQLFTGPIGSGSVTHARISGTTGPVLLLSASIDQRSHASIFNHSAASLYISFGSDTPTINAFDVKITSGSYYELPKPIYQGAVNGTWDAASGFAMMVEFGSE